jgi:predicted helicase
MRSNGVQTNRDDWVYNASKDALRTNIRRMIDFYNRQVDLYGAIIRSVSGAKEKERLAGTLIDMNEKMIKWTGSLIADFVREKRGIFDETHIGVSIYRPFSKSWIYYDPQFNHRFKEKLYPTAHHKNLAISVTGTGSSKDFSCLMVDTLPDLEVISKGQCFPFYHYEKAQAPSDQKASLFDVPVDSSVDSDGYTRKDAITDTALADYRAHYQDDSITKVDVFYHVYGILHSPEYRERYANDLKKMLPRIPFVPGKEGFWAFNKAGRELASLHVGYESMEPYAGLETIISDAGKSLPPYTLFKVDKMRFGGAGKDKDKTVIRYNDYITIQGIPLEAYDYVVNGKPAIEWVMDRYKVKADEDSGIVNDPNDWCREHDDWEYIVRLIGQVVRVSVETVRILNELPAIGAAL